MSRVIDDESAPGARPKPGFERAGLGGLPGGRLRGWGTYCGGLGYPCGGELEIRSHVGDLDLDGLTLVAVVVLPAALDELAGHEHPHAVVRLRLAFSGTDGHAAQRKNPSLTSCHSPLVLLRWLTATVKPTRAAPLWV